MFVFFSSCVTDVLSLNWLFHQKNQFSQKSQGTRPQCINCFDWPSPVGCPKRLARLLACGAFWQVGKRTKRRNDYLLIPFGSSAREIDWEIECQALSRFQVLVIINDVAFVYQTNMGLAFVLQKVLVHNKTLT